MKTELLKTDIIHFDKRDGKEHESLQFKPIREVIGKPWNYGVSRAIEGCNLDHKKALSRLKRLATKAGERIVASAFCNYAVEILVLPHEKETATA